MLKADLHPENDGARWRPQIIHESVDRRASDQIVVEAIRSTGADRLIIVRGTDHPQLLKETKR